MLFRSNIELVSVASTDLVWSTACGVSNFRKERPCSQRIRLPFCSRNIKAVFPVVSTKALVNMQEIHREKENSRLKACTPVKRQSNVKFFPSEQSSLNIDQKEKLSSNFDISGKMQLRSSTSLTSPFPMQFRDRWICILPDAQLELNTYESKDK